MYVHLVFHNMEDLGEKTLKLSAVLLAPTGTVYMLLGDKEGTLNNGDNSIVTKAYHTSGSYSQALVAHISSRQSQSNG